MWRHSIIFPMNPAAIWTLIITVVAVILLISERLRPDLTALLILVVLGISRLVSPGEVFAGFSGTAVITILAISIISEGLRQTGVTLWLGRQMQTLGGQNETHLILVTTLVSAGLSLFMNNIASVGVLLPAVMSLTRQTRVPPSKLLMPLAFGTVLGGMATLLTTSNIIVSGALRDAGLTPFGLLDFLPVGIPIVAVGTLYILFIGRRMLPSRNPAGEAARVHRLQSELYNLYGIEKSLCSISVGSNSDMAQKSLLKGQWMQKLGLLVLGLNRGGRLQMAPGPEEVIKPGDIILAQGKPDHAMLETLDLRVLPNPPRMRRVTDEAVVLGELVLTPHSNLVNKSLREIHFREKYGLNVMGIWRDGQPIDGGIVDLPLHTGDALLVQGPASRLKLLYNDPDFILLEEDQDAVIRPGKTRLAAGITLVTLALAAIGRFSVAEITLAGAILLLLTDCLSMEDAYRSVEWRSIFMIAGMWPLSTAISSSGLADQLVHVLTGLAAGSGPLLLAGLLLLITAILTNVMPGQAAAPIILAPIALAIAKATGADPRAMGMAIALGCSIAFPTPFGHPVNMMVMNSGGYAFRDFLRIGTPLAVLVFIVILLGLKVFWGL